jgi:DNA-binding MarR family transcriptional regulator
MERSDFQSDLNWIADQLQENINVIDRAIDGLIALGFIKREDDNLTLAKEDFSLTHFNQSEADKHLEAFKAHRIFSSDILNRFNTDSRFLFHSGFQATDEESVNWFNSELTKLTKEFQRRSKSGDKNMLIGFQMTTTNVCSTKGDV